MDGHEITDCAESPLRKAYEANVSLRRADLGLSIVPDPVRGDMDTVDHLRSVIRLALGLVEASDDWPTGYRLTVRNVLRSAQFTKATHCRSPTKARP